MTDESKNIPESEYSNLSPRERYEELEHIYNALPPPADAEYIELIQRHLDITAKMGERLMADQDVIDLEKEADALGGEEEKVKLRQQAQKTRVAESKDSPKHQDKIAFVRRWSNEFFEKFGEQAYKKVSYESPKK